MTISYGPDKTVRLNGGIVGLGRMGLTHLAILKSHPAVEQLSVVDSSSFLGKMVEKQIGLPFYQDVDKLLEKAKPDFLIVATPTSSHSDIASAAIERGIHVFVEKPLSLSAKDSESLARRAASRGVIAQVGYVNRFNEIFQAVRGIVQNGELGSLTHVSCEIRSPTVLKPSENGWRSRKTEGGGCLSDLACHGVDLMNYFVGPPKEVVAGSLQSIHSKGVDDCVDALFAYDGFRGSLHVNWSDASCRKPSYRINVEGSEGRIVADQHAYRLFQCASIREGRVGGWKTVYITDIAQPVRMYIRGNEFTRQIDYFIDSIIQNRTVGISGFEAGEQTDRVVECIYNSECKRIVG